MERKRSNKDSNTLSCIVLCSEPSVLRGCCFLFLYMSTSGKGMVFSALWPRKLILTLHSKTIPLSDCPCISWCCPPPPRPFTGVLRSFSISSSLGRNSCSLWATTKTKYLKAKDSWLDGFFVQRSFSVTWVKVISEEEKRGGCGTDETLEEVVKFSYITGKIVGQPVSTTRY